MAERKRTRINSKIGQLPEEMQDQVDEMLRDSSITYEYIAKWLTEQGYAISKSAVGRYALRANKAAARVAENLQQMEAIVKIVEKNPDLDYTKANRMMMMDGLARRLSTAEDEWCDMPLDKAGRLIANLSRVELASEKLRKDYKSKIELAFEGMEAELMAAIKSDPKLAGKLKEILQEAKEKMMNDE
ncbi:MAG: phage protein Gp27 family protein [Anaerovoracaceae bacterium]